jgi:predicted PurR-regulated permease PerM
MFARQLIGGAVKLPFIWTLLGIFAGMETFGLWDLFLGPTLLAILMSIWRDWVTDLDKSETMQIPLSSSTEFDDGQ